MSEAAIDVYYWPTPNGHKITLFLEEAGLPYHVHPIDINKGQQFDPEYLKISPNNKIPAIVDPTPADGGPPLAMFESGAILVYLAEKIGRFIPRDLRGRSETLTWLFWQMSAIGPMLGQNHHFNQYAPEKIPYAIDRFVKESGRLYAVLDKRLAGREFIVGDYSIADMACYPWMTNHVKQGLAIGEFPEVERWLASIKARPATERAWAVGAQVTTPGSTMSDEARKILFGQDARTVRGR